MTTAKPANAPWVLPYITVRDVDKAVDFYKKAFNFKVREVAPGEDGTAMHAELEYKDQLLLFGKENAWGITTKSPATSGVDSPITMCIYTENVDEFYKHAVANKAEGLSPPADMFWGDRACRLKDADGYVWSFATNIGGHK